MYGMAAFLAYQLCNTAMDQIWLIVVCTWIIQEMYKVHRDWNKPRKRNRNQPTRKGCTRFYARTSRRQRANRPGNSRSNWIGTKSDSKKYRHIMIKQLTCLPPLSRPWEEVPKATAENRRPPQEPYGFPQCTASWGNSNGRVKRLADCWDYCCQASRGGCRPFDMTPIPFKLQSTTARHHASQTA
jgi:hypothetical protein